jgi:hypothetical protein
MTVRTDVLSKSLSTHSGERTSRDLSMSSRDLFGVICLSRLQAFLSIRLGHFTLLQNGKYAHRKRQPFKLIRNAARG